MIKSKQLLLYKLILSLLCFSLIFTTGCWSRKEINDIAIIMGAGIDKVEDNKVKLTVQIAVPGQLSKQGSNKPGLPYFTESAIGDTIYSAVRNLSLKIAREIYWGHIIIIVFGENAARSGINPYIDFFLRSPESREFSWVFVTSQEANKLLESKTTLERIPSQKIGFLARSKASYTVTLKDFNLMLATKGNNPVSARIEMTNEENKDDQESTMAILSGTAAFKGDKLIGWLDVPETRGLMWLKSEFVKGIVTVPCPGNKKELVSINVIRGQMKIKPVLKDRIPVFKIKMTLEGDLQEQQCLENLTKPPIAEKLEESVNEQMEERIRKTLDKAQKELKTDIFGFGEAFYRELPKEWPKFENNWDEHFTKAKFEFDIQCKIRRSGLLNQPANASS